MAPREPWQIFERLVAHLFALLFCCVFYWQGFNEALCASNFVVFAFCYLLHLLFVNKEVINNIILQFGMMIKPFVNMLRFWSFTKHSGAGLISIEIQLSILFNNLVWVVLSLQIIRFVICFIRPSDNDVVGFIESSFYVGLVALSFFVFNYFPFLFFSSIGW